ncbi:AAA family ATPase [Metabacillus malikii]|uniref:histidine kinase n=1 Tax=Metabacillus malikii TaxID=1504265 RepID=A0ABT9Z9L9_9BACI|nr:AAA family ATPase [Metabacillus malikii]MDQ0228956.1 putative ATPase/signal transduction histidine kinase [Metabacillus malikii]
MKNIAGYVSLELIANYQHSTLYSGFSTKLRKNVLLKVVNTNFANKNVIENIEKEIHTLQGLNIDQILQPLFIDEQGELMILVYEYEPLMSLEQYLESKQGILSIAEFFPIAISISKAYVHLHFQHIIHKNCNPSTILLNPLTNEIRLTEIRLDNISSDYNAQHEMELPYLSPEHTGRMNQNITDQSDLYSIGVVFYQMITGTLPFNENSPIDWFYAHISKKPLSPSNHNANIPSVLSEIIMKLINKAAKQRYNSAFGLHEDLQMCRKQFQDGDGIAVNIGEKDPLILIEASTHLFGRTYELECINEAVEKLIDGETQFILISGESGTGKTTLAEEVKYQTALKESMFIQGKYNLHNKRPYSGIIDAFRMLLKKVLTLHEVELTKWKVKIMEEVGTNLTVMYKILPELQLIIKAEFNEPDVKSSDVQVHFFYAFQKLIKVFSKVDYPLILFLDDLQWADQASLELIEYILSIQDKNFLLIGTYRTEDIEEGHQLLESISDINKKRPINTIHLQPLPMTTIEGWLSNYIVDKRQLGEFTTVVYQISQGNPFFIKQLLLALNENKVLYFEPNKGTWVFNKNRLSIETIQNNVIPFLVYRIKELPMTTQKILKVASCIGIQFDFDTLQAITNEKEEKIVTSLALAIELGLVLSIEDVLRNEDTDASQQMNFRFIHDRIQQVVYSTLTEEQKSEIHMKLGFYLLNQYEDEKDARLYNLVHHLNIAEKLLNNDQKHQLANLNIDAGEYAQSTAAFQAALKYYQTAYGILKGFNEKQSIPFKLLLALGESYYLNSKFDDAESIFNHLLIATTTKSEKLAIYQMKVTMYTQLHRVEEAVEAGLAALKLLKQTFPLKPTKIHVAYEFLLLKMSLIGRKPNDLIRLPPMNSKDHQHILKLMISLNAPTFHANQNLSTLFMLKAMRMTLKYGLTEMSPLAFNNYALILSAGFNDFSQSYQFGKLALSYAEEQGDRGIIGRTHFVFGSFVNHWNTHIRYSVEHLERAQQLSVSAGNVHLAGATSAFIMIAHFIRGTTIPKMKITLKEQSSFIKEIQYPLMDQFMEEMAQWFDYLASENSFQWDFHLVTDDDSGKIIHYTIRLFIAYLFNKKDYAMKVLKELESLVNNRLTLVIAPEYYFIRALWMIKLLREKDYHYYPKYLMKQKIHHDLKKLTKFAKLSSSNYYAKRCIVQAELAALTGDITSAEHLYESAIKSCEENQFIHILAICYELTGKFYEGQGKQKIASFYYSEAYKTYKQWGANRKVASLLDAYGTLLKSYDRIDFIPSVDKSQSFDLHAIYQSTQLISSEMNIEKLVQKILDLAMKNAGATRGLLLTQSGEQFQIVASKHIYGTEQIYDFSSTIVHYVHRTGESIILDNLDTLDMFQDDIYFKHSDVKSICCLPIYYTNKVKAILYLENNQATKVFTKERMDFLSLISTQAAISLENANLYKNLEEKVIERTFELEQANHHLELANKELAASKDTRSKMLSNISHDLRAPLASVRGYMEAILEGFATTEDIRDEFIRKSIDRIDSLQLLINDIFSLGQLESGNLSFTYDYIPIDRFIETTYRHFQYEVANRNLQFEVSIVNIDDEPYPLVEMDIERMNQVMTNILTNALKFTESGGIYLNLEILSEHVLLSIRDTGSGIDKESLPFIFERDYTKSIRPNVKGNGLGLTICREIVKRHQGEIWAESVFGEGTTIFIQLPITFVEEDFF